LKSSPLLALFLLTQFAAIAGAAERPSARKDPRITQAFKACQTGQAERGVDLLNQLYADTQDPQYVVAQGRCLQKNGHPAEAAQAYKEYLRIAVDATPADRARVQDYLKEAESEVKPETTAPPPAASVGPPLPAAAPPPAIDVSAPLAPAPHDDGATRPLYKRWPFWALVGVVVGGGIATAIVLGNRGGSSPSCPSDIRQCQPY
jgi:hypothetical protein